MCHFAVHAPLVWASAVSLLCTNISQLCKAGPRFTSAPVAAALCGLCTPPTPLTICVLSVRCACCPLQKQFKNFKANMRKVHEGETLQGGVKVESITNDGVIMSHNGSKFLLPRE